MTRESNRVLTLVPQSSLVTADALDQFAEALLGQVLEDFGPAWDVWADVRASREDAGEGECVYLLDGPPQDPVTSRADAPVGYVDVKACQERKEPWTAEASRECLAQLLDPYADLAVGPWSGTLHALEVCAPVLGFTYTRSGVAVADFVLPAWFQDPGSTPDEEPVDWMGVLHKGLSLSPTGYFSFCTDPQKGWEQTAAVRTRPLPKSPPRGSRLWKRMRRCQGVVKP